MCYYFNWKIYTHFNFDEVPQQHHDHHDFNIQLLCSLLIDKIEVLWHHLPLNTRVEGVSKSADWNLFVADSIFNTSIKWFMWVAGSEASKGQSFNIRRKQHMPDDVRYDSKNVHQHFVTLLAVLWSWANHITESSPFDPSIRSHSSNLTRLISPELLQHRAVRKLKQIKCNILGSWPSYKAKTGS